MMTKAEMIERIKAATTVDEIYRLHNRLTAAHVEDIADRKEWLAIEDLMTKRLHDGSMDVSKVIWAF